MSCSKEGSFSGFYDAIRAAISSSVRSLGHCEVIPHGVGVFGAQSVKERPRLCNGLEDLLQPRHVDAFMEFPLQYSDDERVALRCGAIFRVLRVQFGKLRGRVEVNSDGLRVEIIKQLKHLAWPSVLRITGDDRPPCGIEQARHVPPVRNTPAKPHVTSRHGFVQAGAAQCFRRSSIVIVGSHAGSAMWAEDIYS